MWSWLYSRSSELFLFLPFEFLIENSINEYYTHSFSTRFNRARVCVCVYSDCSVYHMAKWLAKWFTVKILFYWIYFGFRMAQEYWMKKKMGDKAKEKRQRISWNTFCVISAPFIDRQWDYECETGFQNSNKKLKINRMNCFFFSAHTNFLPFPTINFY